MAFIKTTQMNTVRAVGATKLCRSCLKMPLAWLSMNSNISSTNAWRLLGTPAVAPLATHQIKPSPRKPSRIATETESRCNVQKSPSPTFFPKKLRW